MDGALHRRNCSTQVCDAGTLGEAYTSGMKCPACRLENPQSALYCDCGHEFVFGSKPLKRIDTRSLPDAAQSRPGVLKCCGIGVVVLLVLLVLSSIAPSIFGYLLFPCLLLPFLLGFGVHDIETLLFGFIGGAFFYAAISYLILWMALSRKVKARDVGDL